MSFVISAEMALGFPRGCSYLQKPWRHHMAPLPHEFISEPCRNILGEFVLWDIGDNSSWNCYPWHPEPFMSGAMHILGIVVGPESARLRTSGGYSTSHSPFVQRRVYFSLTVSSKGVPWCPCGTLSEAGISALLWRINSVLGLTAIHSCRQRALVFRGCFQ